MTETATQDVTAHPAGLVCDAARELWGPDRIVGRAPSQPWTIDARGAIAGPAYTVRFSRAHEPRENAMQDWFAAFDHIPSGTVVVVEVLGDVRGAVVGDACAHRLVEQGVVGMIVDGEVRDYGGIKESGLPTWIRGTRVDGMLVPLMLIEHSVPIRCGGVTVEPGDLVSADHDGIFVVPGDETGAVLEVAEKLSAAEARMFEMIAEGRPIGEVYNKTGRA